MIRKAIIILLTLAALGTVVLWLDSYGARKPQRLADLSAQMLHRGPAGSSDPFTGLRMIYPEDNGMLIAWTQAGALGLRHQLRIKEGTFRPRKSIGFFGFRVNRFDLITAESGSAWADGRSELKRAKNYYVREVALPFWAILAALALYPTVAFIRGPLRRHRRQKKGLCLQCGYNLTGNTCGFCPECGEAITEAGKSGVSR